ncbi:DNA primase [Streptomyces sp. NPDC006285]|uniref:DNA primase n=1 Tax=Streptomyces sp. NPDC006285 TaxID=3364742 RepID=UPI0036AA4EC0
MNRLGMGLAVGAGYVLGRTKKMKLAFAVGTMVAGKRMHLSPRALADLVSQQLQNNPQFKEIGDQLRQDMRGVGKAASGALVERQITGLADRLHGRTNQVKDQLAGVVPDVPGTGRGKKGRDEEPDDEYDEDQDERYADSDGRDEDDDSARDRREADDDEPAEDEERPRARKRAPAKKAPAKKTAEKRGSGKDAPAKKTAARAAKKAPAKKTAAAKSATRRAPRARTTRGGGDDE